MMTEINSKYTKGIVDISHWQTIPFFSQLKADGITRIFHKSTQGIDYIDPKYHERQSLARLGKIGWGAFHFGTAAPVDKQVEFFLNTAKTEHWELMALDWEANTSSQMNLNQAESFVAEYNHQTGKWPILYTGLYMFGTFGSPTNNSPLVNCPLWINHFEETEPQVLPSIYQSHWTFWQYSNGDVGFEPHYHINGHSIDTEVFNGTQQELDEFWPVSEPLDNTF